MPKISCEARNVSSTQRIIHHFQATLCAAKVQADAGETGKRKVRGEGGRAGAGAGAGGDEEEAGGGADEEDH